MLTTLKVKNKYSSDHELGWVCACINGHSFVTEIQNCIKSCFQGKENDWFGKAFNSCKIFIFNPFKSVRFLFVCLPSVCLCSNTYKYTRTAI